MNIGSIAVSGLNAAAVRLGAAANNLTGARATAPATETGEVLGTASRPRQVAESSLATGGVATTLVPVTPAWLLGTDPGSPTGFSAYPNVDIGHELVNLALAANSYKAAARVLSAEAEMSHSLLDIIG